MRLFAAALVLPLILAACGGPSARDVIAQNKAAMDTKRAELRAAAGALPLVDTAASTRLSAPETKPVYDVPGDAFNTAFMAVEEIDGGKPEFDLMLQSDLLNALAWTSANNPLAESALDNQIDGFAERFAIASNTPYVVLYRAVAYEPPVAMDETTFDGGVVKLEAFLVALPAKRQVASCVVDAESAQDVSYSYKKGEDPKARLVAFAHATLWADAKKKLAACLTETTGGVFVFE